MRFHVCGIGSVDVQDTLSYDEVKETTRENLLDE
jgi:hypothetical protein